MIPIKVMIFEYVLNDYCIFDRPNCMVGVLDEIDNAADNTFTSRTTYITREAGY